LFCLLSFCHFTFQCGENSSGLRREASYHYYFFGNETQTSAKNCGEMINIVCFSDIENELLSCNQSTEAHSKLCILFDIYLGSVLLLISLCRLNLCDFAFCFLVQSCHKVGHILME
jgi:hypothetical protein